MSEERYRNIKNSILVNHDTEYSTQHIVYVSFIDITPVIIFLRLNNNNTFLSFIHSNRNADDPS